MRWPIVLPIAACVAAFAGQPINTRVPPPERAGTNPANSTGTGAAAQPAPLGSTTALQPAEEEDIRNALTRELLRVALLDLRASDEPKPDDYVVSALLIQIAEQFAPDDSELVRRRVEAAFNAGDDEMLRAATRSLLQREPGDTVAQLRLVTSNIQQLQSADERLARYEQFLDPRGAGAKLDASLRSRLALDAALLMREQGNEKGFADKLKLAAQLDSTNKEAALLALSFYTEKSDDRFGRLELLSNLLMSDPIDPKVQMQLAREFASVGAWKSARRFHMGAREIVIAGGQSGTFEAALEAGVLDWMVEGPKVTHDKAIKQLDDRREQAALAIKAAEREMRDSKDLPRPEDVRLLVDVEVIRIATGMCMGRVTAYEDGVRDMALTVASNAKKYRDPLKRPENLSDDSVEEAIRSQFFELQMWRAITGVDSDKIESEYNDATAGLDDDDPDLLSLRSLMLIRGGEAAVALELLRDAPDESLWVRFARAAALESLGKKNEAIVEYLAASSLEPFTTHGAFAYSRAVEIGKSDPSLAAEKTRASAATRAEKLGDGIPSWIGDMIKNPRTFQRLEVSMAKRDADPLETVRVKISIRNLSRIPLGLGSSRTISSNLLLAPTVETAGRNLRPLVQAEVLDMERKLRLNPQESVDAWVNLDSGLTGWIVDTLSSGTVRVRWHAIQGFEIKQNGMKEPAAGSLDATTEVLVRSTLPASRVPADQLAKRIAIADEFRLVPLLAAARAIMVTGSNGPPGQPERNALAESLAAKYPLLPVRMRLLTIATMPPGSEIADLTPLDEVIRQERDPAVMGLALITRAVNPEETIIKDAESSSDPTLQRLARIHKHRLLAGAKTYSKSGSGIAARLGGDVATADGTSSPPSNPRPGR